MTFLAGHSARAFVAGFLFFAPAQAADTLSMWIGPQKRPCTAGVMPTQCMLVKWRADQREWENFYGAIAGFEPRPGWSYRIVVRRSVVDHPPADGSSLRYELVKVVSRRKGV